MVLTVEAPNEIYSPENNRNIKLFLAGGITNCPDWQSDIIDKLNVIHTHQVVVIPSWNVTIYNPRRKNFPINDKTAATEQITWEYNHLRDADIISFWFSAGSQNPIVLYELGLWCNAHASTTKLFCIGIDPQYERKQDVIIQTSLARPDIRIVDTIEALAGKISSCISKKMITNR